MTIGTATPIDAARHVTNSVAGADMLKRTYRLDPPLAGHAIVLGSAIEWSSPDRSGGPETYIFPADVNGKILDWAELPGSFQGDMDHARALTEAGYRIVEATA